MRIRIDDDAVRAALAADLDSAGCETRTIGRTLDVTHREPLQQPFELRFFLRAWLARHPEARAELLG